MRPQEPMWSKEGLPTGKRAVAAMGDQSHKKECTTVNTLKKVKARLPQPEKGVTDMKKEKTTTKLQCCKGIRGLGVNSWFLIHTDKDTEIYIYRGSRVYTCLYVYSLVLSAWRAWK